MVLKLFREIWKTGEATVPYPFVPAEVTAGFRGKPEHDPKLCIACAACAIACPPNALKLTTDLDQRPAGGAVLRGSWQPMHEWVWPGCT